MNLINTQIQMRKGILEYCILQIISRGEVYASDDNIAILEGTGNIYPFGTVYFPRVFNGVVHYEPGVFGDSELPSISADGRFVAFQSDASHLLSAAIDTNDKTDVFVYDRTTGVVERVSVTSDGLEGGDMSKKPSLSADPLPISS